MKRKFYIKLIFVKDVLPGFIEKKKKVTYLSKLQYFSYKTQSFEMFDIIKILIKISLKKTEKKI
jgi:hypothetical protein